jgi:hypothetical protein
MWWAVVSTRSPGVMEFNISNRTRRIVNWFAIHPEDETNQRLRRGKELQYVIALLCKFRLIDANKAHVIYARFKT